MGVIPVSARRCLGSIREEGGSTVYSPTILIPLLTTFSS